MSIDVEQRYGSWSGAEIEQFLRSSHIPLRIAFQSNAGPLIVPVWYQYDAGRFWSCSPARSALVKGLRSNPAIAFDVSTNDVPYKGVRGRGQATCTTATSSEPLQILLQRYLGDTKNELSQWLLARQVDEAVIEIRIEWLTSWDFSARMGDIEPIGDRMPGADL